MLVLYRKLTQLMTVIMLPLAGMIAIFPTELFLGMDGGLEGSRMDGADALLVCFR